MKRLSCKFSKKLKANLSKVIKNLFKSEFQWNSSPLVAAVPKGIMMKRVAMMLTVIGMVIVVVVVVVRRQMQHQVLLFVFPQI